MRKIMDLTGQRFGRLIAIEFVCRKKSYSFWKCICDCGNEKIIASTALRSGGTRSCGCLCKEVVHNSVSKEIGWAALTRLIIDYKNRARKKNINFTLTRNEFETLTSSNCYYCGIEPKQIYKPVKFCNPGNYIYNGIDRLDNNLGYTLDNCVPCCGICNFAKKTTSENEFLCWIKRVYEFRRLSSGE